MSRKANFVPQLIAEGVDFSYPGESVLRDIRMTVAAGEFVSILGASGCGKSTLLRVLAGLLPPSAGQVKVSHARLALPDIGFVFQQPTLCPWLRVRDNVALPLLLRGVRRGERRTRSDAALRGVGLTGPDGAKLPRQLSGGMQMRASLARALVTHPELMLLDEPFSALDEVLRQQLCEMFLRLWKEKNWTTVLVTHNVTEAVFLSQRIYILAGKPASIVDTVEIPFERRDTKLRDSLDFLQCVSAVSRRLREAVEHGQGAEERSA